MRSSGQVGVYIVRSEVDMTYRLEMRDMHIDPMAAARLRFCFCAQERAAARGPYGAAGGWRKVRRMARMDAGQFSAGAWMRRRKTPEPTRAPGRQDAWRARHRGGLLFGLLFS